VAKETIGFIGVGRMGQPMASRLIAAGHPVVAYDIQGQALSAIANKGAAAATSPAEVASRAEIVMTSLPVPAVVEAVVLGSDGISSGSRVKTFVDLSTTGPRSRNRSRRRWHHAASPPSMRRCRAALPAP